MRVFKFFALFALVAGMLFAASPRKNRISTLSICLQNAVLCADCEVISDSPHDTCIVCGSHSLLSLSRVLGTLPVQRAQLIDTWVSMPEGHAFSQELSQRALFPADFRSTLVSRWMQCWKKKMVVAHNRFPYRNFPLGDHQLTGIAPSRTGFYNCLKNALRQLPSKST